MKSISKFHLPPDAFEAFLTLIGAQFHAAHYASLMRTTRKEVSIADIDAVYEALVKRGYVKVNGAKVTYALPATQL